MTFKKVIYLKISKGKCIIWIRTLKNWRLPTQLIIFPDFWAKRNKNCPPSKLFLFTSLRAQGRLWPIWVLLVLFTTKQLLLQSIWAAVAAVPFLCQNHDVSSLFNFLFCWNMTSDINPCSFCDLSGFYKSTKTFFFYFYLNVSLSLNLFAFSPTTKYLKSIPFA